MMESNLGVSIISILLFLALASLVLAESIGTNLLRPLGMILIGSIFPSVLKYLTTEVARSTLKSQLSLIVLDFIGMLSVCPSTIISKSSMFCKLSATLVKLSFLSSRCQFCHSEIIGYCLVKHILYRLSL